MTQSSDQQKATEQETPNPGKPGKPVKPGKTSGKRRGRQDTHDWSDESPMVAELMDHIAGGRTIQMMHQEDSRFPDQSTFFVRLRHDEALAKKYARAKVQRIDALVEEFLHVSLDGSRDEPGSRWGHNLHRTKLCADNIKWLAVKLAPKVYGDVQRIEYVELREQLVELAKVLGKHVPEEGKAAAQRDVEEFFDRISR